VFVLIFSALLPFLAGGAAPATATSTVGLSAAVATPSAPPIPLPNDQPVAHP
jgi:hypothetical protein